MLITIAFVCFLGFGGAPMTDASFMVFSGNANLALAEGIVRKLQYAPGTCVASAIQRWRDRCRNRGERARQEVFLSASPPARADQ